VDVTAYLDGDVVGTKTVALSGAYDVESVDFTGVELDRVEWTFDSGFHAIDNVEYTSYAGCIAE
jgi:hypothetical protein